MRRASAVLLAVALAACRVEIEGAACDADANCPGGQACGNDLKCSVRAASCEKCTVDARDCRGSDVVVCTNADPVCGTWAVETACAAEALACSSAACVCADPGGELTVDPYDGSAVDAARAPTGATQPPACRFRRLTDALGAANAWVAGAAGRTAQVRVDASPAVERPIVFGAEEAFPIRVGRDVAVVSAEPDAPANWAIEAPGGSGAAIEVLSGGKLEGFTVFTNAARDAAIAFGCTEDDPAPGSLRSVAVNATSMTNGIVVTEPCRVLLENVSSSGATGAALFVGDVAANVEAEAGAYRASARGLEVRAGAVALRGPEALDLYVGRTFGDGSTLEIDGNSDVGVYASPTDPPSPISLVLDRVLVRDNVGTGVKLEILVPESSVTITRTEIRRNAAASDSSAYGTNQRRAGGVVLVGPSPSEFTFQRNLVRANLGDQVGIDGGGWRLAGEPGCPSAADATGNTFQSCLSNGNEVHAESTGGNLVPAENNYWGTPPDGAFPRINALIDALPRCGPPAPTSLPECPELPTPPTN